MKRKKQLYDELLMKSITQYMRNNLKNIRLDDLEREFYYRANFFNNFIKKSTGVTFSEYLIRLRVNRAKELLKDTDMTIDEIMDFIGYNNKGFFYRKFQEIAGITPAKFRKNSKPSPSAGNL